MTTIQAKVAVLVFTLLAGIVTGWVVHGWKDKAELSHEQRAQIDLANKRANDRVDEEKRAKEDAEARLAGAQADTKRLNDWLNEARASNASLQGQIANATFTPAVVTVPARVPGQPAVSCPRSAVSAPEFVRLYSAAARGTAPGPDD